jgi:signal transduction histidine kinase
MSAQRKRLAFGRIPATSDMAVGTATIMTSDAQPAGDRDAAILANHSEQENARLARLIHDGPAQKLTAAMIELSLWKSDLEDDRALSPDAIQGAVELLQSISAEMREVTNSLRPRSLDLFGLGAAIESIAKRHGNCRFHQATETFSISPERAIQFVRIVESIAAQIDRATSIEMELAELNGEVVLRIDGAADIEIPFHTSARIAAFSGRIERGIGGITVRLPIA